MTDTGTEYRRIKEQQTLEEENRRLRALCRILLSCDKYVRKTDEEYDWIMAQAIDLANELEIKGY